MIPTNETPLKVTATKPKSLHKGRISMPMTHDEWLMSGPGGPNDPGDALDWIETSDEPSTDDVHSPQSPWAQRTWAVVASSGIADAAMARDTNNE